MLYPGYTPTRIPRNIHYGLTWQVDSWCVRRAAAALTPKPSPAVRPGRGGQHGRPVQPTVRHQAPTRSARLSSPRPHHNPGRLTSTGTLHSTSTSAPPGTWTCPSPRRASSRRRRTRATSTQRCAGRGGSGSSSGSSGSGGLAASAQGQLSCGAAERTGIGACTTPHSAAQPLFLRPATPQDYLQEYRDLVAAFTMASVNAAICDYHLRNCPPSQQLTDVCNKVRRALLWDALFLGGKG